MFFSLNLKYRVYMSSQDYRVMQCRMCDKPASVNPRVKQMEVVCKKLANLKEEMKVMKEEMKVMEEENVMYRKSVRKLKDKLNLARNKE